MDPTLVPSINDAFITPPPPQPNPKWHSWVKWWFKSMDPTLVPSINDAFIPPPPPQPNPKWLVPSINVRGWSPWIPPLFPASMTLLSSPPAKPQMAESSDDLSPWIPPLFPASMTLLSPPTPPTKPEMAGSQHQCARMKSMDPTLVPSINDAFITPPTKPQMAESSDDLSPWIPPLFPASMTLLSPPTPPTKPEMAGSQHQCVRMTALCARMTRFLCARMTRLQCAQMTRFQCAQMTR